MIDIKNIKYRLVILSESGKQYNIKDYIEDLGWEENKGELATRISFSVINEKTTEGLLSSITKVGCLVGIFATDGRIDEEVARGTIVTWKPTDSSSSSKLECKCYDDLYNLQESQDNIYHSAGVGTQSVITQIFDDWQVPMEKYEGPNVTHSKLAYKSESLSDVILDVLDDAAKKGAEKCIVQAKKGKVSVIPRGSNKTVYCFEAINTTVVSHSISTAGMVTRVKVIGQADDDGKSSVEATLNGLTKYGIRQKIYTRGKDDSLGDAKTAAQKILDEKGVLDENITVQSPDIPFIRKGDLVYMRVGTMDAYYFVLGIRHNASSFKMTMDLEKAVVQSVNENQVSEKKQYKVGDIVNFHGGTHYVSSYSGSKGYKARAGKAKITISNGSGKAHPWHLIHSDNSSNVYGWVDDGTFD